MHYVVGRRALLRIAVQAFRAAVKKLLRANEKLLIAREFVAEHKKVDKRRRVYRVPE